MTWWARRRLRNRILLPFALLLVGVLLATLWVGSAAVTAWVEASLRQQFDVTANVFRVLLAERAGRLRGETSLLAADFALKRALVTYDPDTLASVAQNQRERLGVALLWIVDDRGKLLAAAGGGATVGSDVTSVHPLARVMEVGRVDVVVTEVADKLMQVVATPVFAPDPIGYLVAGKPIDDETARGLAATTGHGSASHPHDVFARPDAPTSARRRCRSAPASWRASSIARRRRADHLPGAPEGARMLSALILIEAELEPRCSSWCRRRDGALGPPASCRSG